MSSQYCGPSRFRRCFFWDSIHRNAHNFSNYGARHSQFDDFDIGNIMYVASAELPCSIDVYRHVTLTLARSRYGTVLLWESAKKRGAAALGLSGIEARVSGRQPTRAQYLRPRGRPTLFGAPVEEALHALRAGDAKTHNRLIVEQAERLEGFDAIMLAQFSTSHAAEAVRARTNVPVLTSPATTVAKMRALVTRQVAPTSLGEDT